MCGYACGCCRTVLCCAVWYVWCCAVRHGAVLCCVWVLSMGTGRLGAVPYRRISPLAQTALTSPPGLVGGPDHPQGV